MLEPEFIELRVSTVLDHGKADLDAQHLAPPTPRQWSAAVGGYRLQLPTGASRPPTGVPEVSPRLQLRLPPIDGSRASPRGSRRAVPRALLHLHTVNTKPRKAHTTHTTAALLTQVRYAPHTPSFQPQAHTSADPLHLCLAVWRPHATYSFYHALTASSPLTPTSEPSRSSIGSTTSVPATARTARHSSRAAARYRASGRSRALAVARYFLFRR